MKTGESQVGLVFCACWNDHISLRWQKCGHFLLLVMSFLLLSVILPYITMIARNFFPAFLPFVSDAGGYPPCSGIYTIFLVLSAFFGWIAFPIVYATINHRSVHNWKFLKLVNQLAFLVVGISALGLTITACYPIGYTDLPNRYEWVMTVFHEHCFGGTMAIVGIVCYQFLISVLWWFLPDASKADKYIKVGIVVIFLIFGILCMYPVPAILLEQLGPNPFDLARMKKLSYDLTRVYSVSHLILSVAEYILFSFTALNIGLMYKDLQRVSLRIVLRHKSCTTEADEIIPSIKLKTIY